MTLSLSPHLFFSFSALSLSHSTPSWLHAIYLSLDSRTLSSYFHSPGWISLTLTHCLETHTLTAALPPVWLLLLVLVEVLLFVMLAVLLLLLIAPRLVLVLLVLLCWCHRC